MKKLILFSAMAAVAITAAADTTYWFQEGFENKKPTDWTVNCATNTTSHGLYTGENAAKLGFKDNSDGNDITNAIASYAGPDKNLMTPTVENAGTLTFWIKVSSKKIYGLTLHVQTVKNGVATDIWSEILDNAHGYSSTWKDITIPINTADPVAINFYMEQTAFNFSDTDNVIRAYAVIDDIALSAYEGEIVVPYVSAMKYDFSEPCWAVTLPESISSGNFPSFRIVDPNNEDCVWELNHAYPEAKTQSCASNDIDKHFRRLVIDKASANGYVITPYVVNVSALTLHLSSGSNGGSLKVEMQEVGKPWNELATITDLKQIKSANGVTSDSQHVIDIIADETPASRAEGDPKPIRFRLSNTASTAAQLWHLETTAGPTTGIDSVEANEPGVVNVYNMQGVALRKGVEASEATQGLAPGLYIVGTKKVIVQ